MMHSCGQEEDLGGRVRSGGTVGLTGGHGGCRGQDYSPPCTLNPYLLATALLAFCLIRIYRKGLPWWHSG